MGGLLYNGSLETPKCKDGRDVLRSRQSDTWLSSRKLFIKMYLERTRKEGWGELPQSGEEWGSEGKQPGPLITPKGPAQRSDYCKDGMLAASSSEVENKQSLWNPISCPSANSWPRMEQARAKGLPGGNACVGLAQGEHRERWNPAPGLGPEPRWPRRAFSF